MTEQEINEFQKVVWEYYDLHGRHELPWRLPDTDGSFDPYKIMVSEIMLQQTQVNRVIPKYLAFLEQFPTVADLAKAEQGNVLRAWQGLGYNRRAKFLWQAAQMIIHDYEGEFPATDTKLVKLPGIGKNTAGAIQAYTWSKPVVFVETNIRTVFIHHFFADQMNISDNEILELVALTLPEGKEQPDKAIGLSYARSWYWALMDYGSYLKQIIGNLNKLSNQYTKQSAFHGSKRQVRGAVIRALAQNAASLLDLQQKISDERLNEVLVELMAEGLVKQSGTTFSL